eukprot:COSAG04_NODE_25171_length_311_cov_0.735849_1_plen_22_part_10
MLVFQLVLNLAETFVVSQRHSL